MKRNNRVAPDVQVRSPARSLAQRLDNYYRPARDSRSEQALQSGISRLSGLFEEKANRAKQTQRKDEFQQGVADAMREQAGEEIQGVKTGSLFRQHSSFYTAGLNETRGKAAATEFKNQLALEYENWEGRHADDDGSGFREWMNDRVNGFIDSLGDNESRLTGALPVLNEVANNFAAQHTAFTNQRLQEEAFKATQTIAGGIFDDFHSGTLTEDEAIAQIREEAGALYDVEGGNANSVLVDAAIRYANTHNDPDPILLLGKAHTSGELPLSIENQERLANAIDAVEADINREAREQEQIRDAEHKAAHQAALADFGQQLAADPYAPLPRHGEVGHDLWTDMNRLRQAHITASQNTNPVEGSIARLNLDVALRDAGSARDAVAVLHEFVQSHPNVLTGAQVSAYSARIQEQLDPTSLMNNDYVKQQGRLFFQQVNQFETDAFSPDQITIMQTKAEQHFLDFVMSQSG